MADISQSTDYEEVEAFLTEYLDANWTKLEHPWDKVLDKCCQAVQDCLELGLNGED